MLQYIKLLDENERSQYSQFKDLLICLKQLSYGDNSHSFRYIDEIDKRNVNVWNNYSHFIDREDSFFWVNDYETSLKAYSFEHNMFMLDTFGDEWYNDAVKYFEENNMEDNLRLLKSAKNQHEQDLLADEEFQKTLEEENEKL